jgi:hypothetical protein
MVNPNNNDNFNDQALRINRILKKENDSLKSDGEVLDTIYDLIRKTIKDCELKSRYFQSRGGNLPSQNDGRLQFAKEILQLLKDNEEE